MPEKNKLLPQLGFSFKRAGAHTSRTMMLEELRGLLTCIDKSAADKRDYLRAIADENCLGKRSVKTRSLTYRYLVNLYSLDHTHVLFRVLLYFWHRDSDGRPLL